jgi:hypothetical protein
LDKEFYLYFLMTDLAFLRFDFAGTYLINFLFLL